MDDAQIGARIVAALHPASGDEARRRALMRQQMFGTDAAEPMRVGRFTIEQRLGAGAAGVVYRAHDPVLDRPVAVKILRTGLSDAAAQRMVREARALARINHANVVLLFEVGEVDAQFFIVMEYVAGQTLATWQVGRGADAILAAYLDAARGLAVVHRAGLVHRDFKPANVLVGEDGRVRVADFGLVREDGAVPEERQRWSPVSVDLTTTGSVLGTPAYMAPELRALSAADHRSDQYAFCVALVEALTGRRPNLGMSGPTPPHDGEPKVDLPAHLRRPLLRGLAPDPADRWPDLDSLIAALARPRRSRWWGAALVAMMVVGAVVWAIGGQQPEPAPGLAQAQARVDTDPSTAALILQSVDPDTPGWADAARRVLMRPLARVLRPSADVVRLGLNRQSGLSAMFQDGRRVTFEGAVERPAASSAFAAAWLIDRATPAQLAAIHTLDVAEVWRAGNLMPDGQVRVRVRAGVVDIAPDGVLTPLPYRVTGPAWLAPGGGGIMTLPRPPGVERYLPFDADEPPQVISEGAVGATRTDQVIALGHGDDRVVVWDGEQRTALTSPRAPSGRLEVSADARRLVVGADDRLFTWDLARGATDAVELPGASRSRIFEFFGNDAVVRARPGRGADLVNLRTLRVTPLAGMAEQVDTVAADGHRVATYEPSRTLRLWDLSGTHGEVIGRHAAPVWSGGRGPDGRWLATTGMDRAVQLFDLKGETSSRVLQGFAGSVYLVAFSPDGTQLAASSADGTVRLWQLERPDRVPAVFSGHEGFAYALAFSPDGRHLAVGDRMGAVRLWPTQSGGEHRLLGRHPGLMVRIHTLAFSADGRQVWSAAKSGSILRFSVDGGAVDALESPARYPVVGRLPDGEMLTTASDGVVRIWAANGATIEAYTHDATPTVWGAHADRVGVGYTDGALMIWTRGQPDQPTWRVPRGSITAETLAFNADGDRLAVGDVDGRILVYDLPSTRPSWQFSGHGASVRHLSFVGDDIVSASYDGSVRRWAAPTTPKGMLQRLKARTADCLTPAQRVAWLGESVDNAAIAAGACDDEAR